MTNTAVVAADPLAELRQLAAELQQAEEHAAEIRRRRDLAIRRAPSTLSHSEIARTVGVTRQWVMKLRTGS